MHCGLKYHTSKGGSVRLSYIIYLLCYALPLCQTIRILFFQPEFSSVVNGRMAPIQKQVNKGINIMHSLCKKKKRKKTTSTNNIKALSRWYILGEKIKYLEPFSCFKNLATDNIVWTFWTTYTHKKQIFPIFHQDTKTLGGFSL